MDSCRLEESVGAAMGPAPLPHPACIPTKKHMQPAPTWQGGVAGQRAGAALRAARATGRHACAPAVLHCRQRVCSSRQEAGRLPGLCRGMMTWSAMCGELRGRLSTRQCSSVLGCPRPACTWPNSGTNSCRAYLSLRRPATLAISPIEAVLTKVKKTAISCGKTLTGEVHLFHPVCIR